MDCERLRSWQPGATEEQLEAFAREHRMKAGRSLKTNALSFFGLPLPPRSAVMRKVILWKIWRISPSAMPSLPRFWKCLTGNAGTMTARLATTWK